MASARWQGQGVDDKEGQESEAEGGDVCKIDGVRGVAALWWLRIGDEAALGCRDCAWYW